MEFPANDEIVLTPIKPGQKDKRSLPQRGMIQVIFGPMFSGKTTELLRRVRRYKIRGDNCLLLKTRDSRYLDDEVKVVSHDLFNHLEAFPCDRLYQSLSQSQNCDVIGIDEGQFFPDLIEFCEDMANRGKIVVVAALDSDFRREEFGEICKLVAKAERVTKLHSICHFCKDDASFTARVSSETEQKVIGGADKYRPVCRICYFNLKSKYSPYSSDNEE